MSVIFALKKRATKKLKFFGVFLKSRYFVGGPFDMNVDKFW